MSTSELPKVVSIATDPTCTQALQVFAAKADLIDLPMDLEKLCELTYSPPPPVIICGVPPEGISLIEVAQVLRMQFPKAQILYVTPHRDGFERKVFIKNGFSDAYLLPWDNSAFHDVVREGIARANSAEKVYKTVRLVDIQAGTTLEFNTFIHLPMNNKYVRFSGAGDPIDPERAQKLAKSQISAVQVDLVEMPKFYEYTARRLHEMGKDGTISETERQEKMKHAVRELIGGIFNTTAKDSTVESGKAVIQDCQQIVSAYIGQSDTKNNWFGKLMNLADNKSTTYDHAASVSTLAALFSMALGIGKPEDLAIAGVLHDIGLSELPEALQQKKELELSPEEFELFKTHPEKTLGLVRQRKLIVPEIVLKVIAQHHEKWNGTGYPKKLVQKRICPEAQLLAIADLFDEFTAVKEGQPRLTPAEALKKILALNTTDESQASFDPGILKKLVALFLTDAPTQAA